VGVPLNLNNTAKYVELSVEGLRTRVRFPPAPPIRCIIKYHDASESPLVNSLGAFFMSSVISRHILTYPNLLG
jgi:hypothetical protein